VILAFSGNDSTPCTGAGRLRRTDYDRLWAKNLHVVVGFWLKHHAAVLLVGPPGRVVPYPGDYFTTIDTLAKREADRHGAHVRYLDSGAALRDPKHHQYRTRLPCLPAERRDHRCAPDGTILVRSSDGFHLCNPPANPCGSYASGIERWAGAITRAAKATPSIG
jgi:hypothetical protein